MSDLTYTTQQLSDSQSGVPNENQDPVVSGKDVYVGYYTAGEIVLDVSNNEGQTFSAVELAKVGSSSELPRIVTVGSRVYVAWQEGGDIYTSYGIDGGKRFSKPVDLGVGVGPQISASGDNVIIGAATKGQTAINVWVSNDAAKSWSGVESMAAPPGKLSETVVQSAHGSDYVSWNEVTPDKHIHSFEATSNNSGATFNPTIDLDPAYATSVEPIFSLSSNGRLNLVFRTDLGDLIYVDSVDRGKTFSAPLVIAKNSRHATVATDGANVDVSYLQRGAKDWQVEFLHSGDNGRTWDAPVDLGNTGWVDSFHPDDDPLMPSEEAQDGYVNVSWVGINGAHASISDNYGEAGSFTRSVFLGHGSSVMAAGPFTLWLNSADRAELTTFQTGFFDGSAAAVAATSTAARQQLVQAAASFGANAAVAGLDPMSVTPKMSELATLASGRGHFQAQ